MEPTRIVYSSNEELCNAIQLLYSSNEELCITSHMLYKHNHYDDDMVTLKVSSRLRKEFDNEAFPDLHIVLLGDGQVYTMCVSKTPIHLTMYDLCKKSVKTFLSNTSLSLPLNSPFDPYYLDLLREYMDVEEVTRYIDGILKVGCEKTFSNKFYSIQRAIVDSIKSQSNYRLWRDSEIEKIPLKYRSRPTFDGSTPNYTNTKRNSDIYNTNNNGVRFLSIDLKSANFQALKIWGLTDTLDVLHMSEGDIPISNDVNTTWDSFIRKFTDIEYYIKCKRFRMKVLSHAYLFPGKQTRVWENTMIEILNELIQNDILRQEDFAAFKSDEILFYLPSLETMDNCKRFIAEKFPHLLIRVETFVLEQLDKKFPFFIKRGENQMTWKCVNAQELPQCIRKLKNEPVTQKDIDTLGFKIEFSE
jgi:hypothetical protein